MQPFDALSLRAVISEARPLLVNRKVERVYQPARDEIVLLLRSKAGNVHLLLSAHSALGRLCLSVAPAGERKTATPQFCQILRKHLSGATIIAVEQIAGERVADIIFACTDELGTASLKILTAEIMGRHSNLIFWDKASEKILAASHLVTSDMSRHREIAPGLKYVRPPQQHKENIFAVSRAAFVRHFDRRPESGQTLEQWLQATFSGLGRHLCEELAQASGDDKEALWQHICELQTLTRYSPARRADLTAYTVLPWLETAGDAEFGGWVQFPTVNDMIDDYFLCLARRDEMQHLKDRIRQELKVETDRLQARISAAEKQLDTTGEIDTFKLSGDLILANLQAIAPGQQVLECENLFASGSERLSIALNANLSSAANAQHYYRLYSKARVRQSTATVTLREAQDRLQVLQTHVAALDAASSFEDLDRLKATVLERGQSATARAPAARVAGTSKQKQKKLLSTKSSDGWLIYIGRNRFENDYMLSKIAQAQDIWLHVLGQEGAHVLIKVPSKHTPPGSTIAEAAQLAARFSRVSLGAKIKVAYTHCKYVKKIAADKPGLVRYENEKTIEVDTAQPMPPSLRKLFQP